MGFGNMGDDCATGVRYAQPIHGEKLYYGDSSSPQAKTWWPVPHAAALDDMPAIMPEVYKHYWRIRQLKAITRPRT